METENTVRPVGWVTVPCQRRAESGLTRAVYRGREGAQSLAPAVAGVSHQTTPSRHPIPVPPHQLSPSLPHSTPLISSLSLPTRGLPTSPSPFLSPMSLFEPLHASSTVSDVEVGVPPQSSGSLLTRHARAIIVSLSVFSSLLIAALAVLLFFLLSSSSPRSPHWKSSPPPLPFFTTGNPHPIGQPPFVPRLSVLARVAEDMDFSRNLSVDPCDNFYQYACGGWIAAQPTPGGTQITTKGFQDARADNAEYVREVIEADWPLLTPYFQACMDGDARERLGFQPTRWFMDGLDPNKRLLTKEEAFYWLGLLRQQMRLTSIFSLTVGSNATNARQSILRMGTGGTTFPYLSYYYGPTNITKRISDGIAAMLTAAGDARADATVWATRIVEFETGLIKVFNRVQIEEEGRTYTEEEWGQKVLADERKNLAASNNYYQLQELETLMPNTPIKAFFQGTSLPQVLATGGVVGYAQLTDNTTFVMLDQYLKDVDPITIQLYARWHALNVSAPYLTGSLRELHLKHFNLQGVDQLPPHYYACSEAVMQQLPDLFGRYFMARRLPPEMRTQAREMISWIKQAFEGNLPQVSWMDDATRAVAAEKAYAVFEAGGRTR